MNRFRQQFAPVVRDIVLNSWINGRLTPRRLRRPLLNAVGHMVHDTAVISTDLFLGAYTGLEVGAGSFINYGCFMDLGAPTVIGERVAIGYGVMFITISHAVGSADARAGDGFKKSIRIGDGTWIGARATILPGVTVGEGCVIAAGAVVTADCDPHSLYGGVPARKIRALDAQPLHVP